MPRQLKSAICSVSAILAGSLSAAADELVVNGGAELGSVQGWSLDASAVPNGDIIFGAVGQRSGFAPRDGAFFFECSAAQTGAPVGSGAIVRMFQVIELADPASALAFRGWIGSETSNSCDPGRATLTFLDAQGDDLAIGADTGWILSGVWSEFEESVDVPAGAALVRVELLARLDCGVFIDTFFDSISLRTACPADLTGSSDPGDPGYGQPDGDADGDDFFFYLDAFVATDLGVCDLTGRADSNDASFGVPDGDCDADDFFFYLDRFAEGCP